MPSMRVTEVWADPRIVPAAKTRAVTLRPARIRRLMVRPTFPHLQGERRPAKRRFDLPRATRQARELS